MIRKTSEQFRLFRQYFYLHFEHVNWHKSYFIVNILYNKQRYLVHKSCVSNNIVFRILRYNTCLFDMRYAYFLCLPHRPFHKIIDFGSMTDEELGEIWFLPSLLFSTHTKQSSITLPLPVLVYIIKTSSLPYGPDRGYSNLYKIWKMCTNDIAYFCYIQIYLLQ